MPLFFPLVISFLSTTCSRSECDPLARSSQYHWNSPMQYGSFMTPATSFLRTRTHGGNGVLLNCLALVHSDMRSVSVSPCCQPLTLPANFADGDSGIHDSEPGKEAQYRGVYVAILIFKSETEP
ncbi:hypothetical protein FA13DRAFT_1742528 [Coprinellus micaceus]|uniref:Secreted protein n=1 Tax=Coprinellus micaceus TaxID=71717 RepID=A0A4Y7SHB9_COPMI|nr:hypothetical protein FA13DRAFT_1742528 [Coprinellus micaceus]